MAGTFVPSASLRGLFCGVDGIALVPAGFLLFAVDEARILAGAAMDTVGTGRLFAAGVGSWAAAPTFVSAPGVMPSWLRVAMVAAMLERSAGEVILSA